MVELDGDLVLAGLAVGDRKVLEVLGELTAGAGDLDNAGLDVNGD